MFDFSLKGLPGRNGYPGLPGRKGEAGDLIGADGIKGQLKYYFKKNNELSNLLLINRTSRRTW